MSYELQKIRRVSAYAHPRVETGSLQIDDDWPGVFIRGDHALMGYLPALKHALEALDRAPGGLHHVETCMAVTEIKNLIELLESCAVKQSAPK